MKVKIEISICTGLMLNDHSNLYIESTTVLSENNTYNCLIRRVYMPIREIQHWTNNYY